MSLIIYSREGPLARITLNRPEKLNAFNVELVDELMAAVSKAAASEARMLVIQAEGKGFSGGFDLSDIEQSSDGDLLLRLIRVERLVQAVHHAPIATLALVHGPCYGAAAELVAACQWRVATSDASFRMPGPHFGVVLGSRRLTDLVGEDAFRRLVLRDGPFTAQDGFAEGYLTRVAEKSGWTDIESRILADVSAIDAGTYAGILSQQRRDLRDSDLAALVRSGSDGSLKASILSHLRQMAAQRETAAGKARGQQAALSDFTFGTGS